MDEVVVFRAKAIKRSTASDALKELPAKSCANDIERIRATITESEAATLVVMSHLSEYRDVLRRMRAFCTSFSDGTKLQDLDGMAKARDQILADLARIEFLWPKP